LIHYTKTLKGAGQIQGGAGQTQGGANAPPRPPLKETLENKLQAFTFAAITLV